MSKKGKTLITALGVLLLLGGGYYFSLSGKKGASDYSEYTAPLRLGNLDAAELAKIEAPGFTLEKREGNWELSYLEGGIPPGGIALDQNQIGFLSYNLAGVTTERIVDEEPGDLSVYGLDKDFHKTGVIDAAGKRAEYLLGEMTPSRTSYYVMEEGDPAVYSVFSYIAASLRFTLDSIRQRSLGPAFEAGVLRRLTIDAPEHKIVIIQKPETLPPHLPASYSTHLLTSPYRLVRGVNSEAMYSLLATMNESTIEDFIEDDPPSLEPYGLDKPVRITLESRAETLDLLTGNEINGKRYAKLAGLRGVFTLSGLENVINAKPISLIDRFALLVNIQDVERLTISGGDRDLAADLRDEGNNAEFFLNGKKAEARSFRKFYEAVVGLLVDAEYPAGSAAVSENERSIQIVFTLNSSEEHLSITLLPYNRDFYALRQEGTTEFLISRAQIRRIFESADAVVFE